MAQSHVPARPHQKVGEEAESNVPTGLLAVPSPQSLDPSQLLSSAPRVDVASPTATFIRSDPAAFGPESFLASPSPLLVSSPPEAFTPRSAFKLSPSPHTQAKSNIKVLKPVQTSKVRRFSQAQRVLLAEYQEAVQQVLPALQPDSSFDSVDAIEEVQAVKRGYWQLLWITCSVTCITLLFPLAIFLLPAATIGGRGRFRTTPWNIATARRTTVTTTSVPVERVTYDAEEHYLLPPGVNVSTFCGKSWDRDVRLPPSASFPTTPRFVDNSPELQQRIVICNLDTNLKRALGAGVSQRAGHGCRRIT